MIADSYPEHDRTSCSDSHLVNITPDGSGCHRCNALAFDQLDALQDKTALLNARISQLERMFAVSCAKLSAINEALGIVPISIDDGAGKIIEAIEQLEVDIAELETQIASAQQQEPVLYQVRNLYNNFGWFDCSKLESKQLSTGKAVEIRKLYDAPAIPKVALPVMAGQLTDEQIEHIFLSYSGKWDGDMWTIEDADLHPFARTILAQSARQGAYEALDAARYRHIRAGHVEIAHDGEDFYMAVGDTGACYSKKNLNYFDAAIDADILRLESKGEQK